MKIELFHNLKSTPRRPRTRLAVCLKMGLSTGPRPMEKRMEMRPPIMITGEKKIGEASQARTLSKAKKARRP